jgi:methyl-accepting chemotaxis protein
MAGPASEQVGRMREVLWAGGTSGELQGLTGKAWFDASSARIDLLKTAEDRIAADLIAATATIVDQADGRLRLLAVIVATVFAACTGVVLLLGRGITRPLAQMRAAMERLAGGDSDFVVPGTGRRDEIGEMAGAVEVFRHNAIERRQLAAEQQQVQERAAEERRADMHRIASQFEAAVGEIVGAVSSSSTELEAAAGTLTDTAERTQRLSSQVASASEEASTNVQSVASATDELSASVHEIGRQVHESSRIARDAVDQARKTDGRIAELAQAAHRIGDVVKLITAVAEQTNLLALNATIEAARAGEAGRGFAVVAQEVKALAGQTAKATDEIGQQIAAMQTATEDSVASIQEIGATIDRVAGIAQSIAAAVEQQGAATREIARNVQQAAHGTSEVAAKITAVDRGASETGSASAQVLSSAQALASEGSKLKLELQQFLATVRAA